MAEIPKKTPGRRVLVVRINSLRQAMAAVQNMPVIVARMREKGYDGIELQIAKEVEKRAMPRLAGVFRVRTFLKYIEVAQGDELFILPEYISAVKPPEGARVVEGVVTLQDETPAMVEDETA